MGYELMIFLSFKKNLLYCGEGYFHNTDVTYASWHLKSLATPVLVEKFVQINEKVLSIHISERVCLILQKCLSDSLNHIHIWDIWLAVPCWFLPNMNTMLTGKQSWILLIIEIVDSNKWWKLLTQWKWFSSDCFLHLPWQPSQKGGN